MKTEKIEEYIKEIGLYNSGRQRELVYKKMYLSSLLRKNGYTLARIGKLFNKEHSTVMYWIKIHDNFIETKDKLYKDYIKAEVNLFEPSVEVKRDLVQDVLECNNTTQLSMIKNRILKGEY